MRSIRPLLTATGLVAALTLTATACGPDKDATAGLPGDLGDALEKHGVDPEKQKDVEWKNWDKDKWLSKAEEFVNPVIDGLWKPDRMAAADEPAKTMAAGDLTAGQDVSDPEPAPVRAKPENGTKSLEETEGNALPVSFDAPEIQQISGMGAWGYPAGPPYDGLLTHQCVDRPGRLSIAPGTPTMYRIGCTMTGGSSGGGRFVAGPDGKSTLVSNTSIGPVTSGWPAGPRLDDDARRTFTVMSDRFAGR